MTKDDVYKDIGRAFSERRDLLMKIKCLKHRLAETSRALATIVGNPLNAEAAATLDNASDPLADWIDLKAAHERLAELDKILD